MAYDLSNMGPIINQFGGATQGIGQGIADRTKMLGRRSLWENLTKKHTDRAEKRALSELGLVAPPVPGMDGYLEFQKQLQAAKNAGNMAMALSPLSEPYAFNELGYGLKKDGTSGKADPLATPEAQAKQRQLLTGYATANTQLATAQQAGDTPTYQAALQSMNDITAQYKMLTGDDITKVFNPLSAVSSSAANTKEGLIKTGRLQDQALGRRQAASTDARARVDKWVAEKAGSKTKLKDLARGVAMSRSLINLSDSEKATPEALYASIKALSGIIEPGLAVTDSEVKGYMGANFFTGMANGVNSVGSALKKGLKDFQGMYPTAKDLGTANPATLRSVLKLADELGRTGTSFLEQIVSGSTTNLSGILERQLRATYKADIPPADLTEIIESAVAELGQRLKTDFSTDALPAVAADAYMTKAEKAKAKAAANPPADGAVALNADGTPITLPTLDEVKNYKKSNTNLAGSQVGPIVGNAINSVVDSAIGSDTPAETTSTRASRLRALKKTRGTKE